VETSDVSWPDPMKYLDFSDRGLTVDQSSDTIIVVTAARPVKGFVFNERKGVKLSDNGFDVMPGEKHTVRVEGAAPSSLDWRYINT
jgi:beta-mannosidase